MSNYQDYNAQSTQVLWEGKSHDLTSAASGGRIVSASYRLTTDSLYFASGVLSTREESIPLWAIIDADISQTMTQKALGVADLRLKLDGNVQARFGQAVVLLKSIKDAREVRDCMLRQANAVRAYWQQYEHARSIEQARASAAYFNVGAPAPQQQQPAVTAPPSSGQSDFMEQLKKLGEMREAGLLTDEEFAAAKAKLLG